MWASLICCVFFVRNHCIIQWSSHVYHHSSYVWLRNIYRGNLLCRTKVWTRVRRFAWDHRLNFSIRDVVGRNVHWIKCCLTKVSDKVLFWKRFISFDFLPRQLNHRTTCFSKKLSPHFYHYVPDFSSSICSSLTVQEIKLNTW